MEEKHHFVKNWKELKKLVSNTNHNKETLILCGFVNEVKHVSNDTFTYNTKKLVFKKVSINLLKECYK